jgi:hypothetical protein
MLIACVEHLGGHITRVRAFDSTVDEKKWVNMSREAVVGAIKRGVTCYTYFKKTTTGELEVGAQIHVVTVNYIDYLRTDKDGTAKDNLGSLPSLVDCPV